MSTLIHDDVIHLGVHGGPSYGQTPWSSDDVPGKEEGAIKPWVFDTGTVLALPVFAFAFQCHAQVVSIFAELRDEEGDFGSNLETHSVTEIERDGAMDGESMGQTDDGEEDDDELFVDAMSQSGHGSVDGSSRGGSPAPTLNQRLNQDRRVSSGSGSNDGGVFGFVTRRRSSGASGSTLSMTLSLSPVRGRDRDPPARIPMRLHNPFNLGPGGFHGDRVTESGVEVDEDTEEIYFLERKRSATMERVTFWSVLFVLVGYLLVGEFAYVAHPHIPSDKFNKFNMLTAYSTHDGTTTAATAAAGVSALVTYPVSHFVSRAALDDVYVAMAGKERAFPGRAPLKRHMGQTLVFVGMTTATAALVRDLGVVFRVFASIGGSLVVFIMPGILLLQPKYHAVGIDVDGSVGDGDGDTQGADFGVGRVPTGETGDEETAHGHRRVRSRHWTEMGDSIGGYDELNFGSGSVTALDFPLLRRGEHDTTVDTRNKERSVPVRAVAQGVALLSMGGLVAIADVYLTFFRKEPGGGWTTYS
jgi:hypothetical protein